MTENTNPDIRTLQKWMTACKAQETVIQRLIDLQTTQHEAEKRRREADEEFHHFLLNECANELFEL